MDFVGDHLPQVPFLDLPILTGEDLHEAAMAKKSTAGGLDGWAWNEIKALSSSWFVGLALVLRQIETAGRWPQGLLDEFFAMIPKAGGDSTPLANVLYVSYQQFIAFGPQFVLPTLGTGFLRGFLTQSLVLARAFLRSMLGTPLPLTLRRFLVRLAILTFISSLLM